MTQSRRGLGEILIEEGVLSTKEFDEVLKKSRARNLTLEDTLFKLGYLSRDQLDGMLAIQHGCEFIDLRSIEIDGESAGAISPELAAELRILPFAHDEDTLSVAIAADALGATPLEEITGPIERDTGKKVKVSLCNSGALDEALQRLSRDESRGDEAGDEPPVSPPSPPEEDSSSTTRTAQSDEGDAFLRARFEELYNVGQNALLSGGSHPFSRDLASEIEEARSKLGEGQKYADSGFEGDAVEAAEAAVALLRKASARADALEGDWEKLIHEANRLRARIAALESENVGEYAPAEMEELVGIGDAMAGCVNERNVDGLRTLIERGLKSTEKASRLEPGRTGGREQVIADLAQGREAVSRAHAAGAKEFSPDVLEEAEQYLERAEAFARHAQWEDVRESLSRTRTKAHEAERKAVSAAEEKQRLTIELRKAVRSASAVFEKAFSHQFANDVIEDLMGVKEIIGEAKACFESCEFEIGIELANDAAGKIEGKIIPLAGEAERAWGELFSRADAASEKIQGIDVPLALKVAPDDMKSLFGSEREMIAALCERNRDRLAETIEACEGLAGRVEESLFAAYGNLKDAGSVIEAVDSLLASTAASGIDESVAHTYEESRRMLDEARAHLQQGDAEAAKIRAMAARSRLESEVIGPQDSARSRWSDLSRQAGEASDRIHSLNMVLGLNVIPEKMESLFSSEREMVAALSAGDGKALADSIEACERLIGAITQRLAEAEDSLGRVEGVVEEVDALLASAAAEGIDEIVASAYDESRRLLDEARSFFKGGDADAALSRAEAARVKIESEVIEPRDSAGRLWNELSQKAISVSEQIQAMNVPIVLRAAPEQMERLFRLERGMIGSMSGRDSDRLSAAVSACEHLVGEIQQHMDGAVESIRGAEATIAKVAGLMAIATASGIDEKVAPSFDEARRMMEKAEGMLDGGDGRAALEIAQAALTKLEREVVERQALLRREWGELIDRAERVFGRRHGIAPMLAEAAAPELIEKLFEAEREMAASLFEHDPSRLAGAISTCEELLDEIEPAASELGQGLERARTSSARLIGEADSACSADAMSYCPDLVNSLRNRACRMSECAAAMDLPGLEEAISSVESAMRAISVKIETEKARRHDDLLDQLEEVEGTVQEAVQKCAGNYSPDMLEDAYVDLNRIRGNLAAGPEALTAELEHRLSRDLAVARTKVWQVEFMRERFEREREETLRQLRVKLDAARESLAECATLDFADPASPLMLEAGGILERVDTLIIEGEVEASFEQIRRVDALADLILSDAAEREERWLALSGSLTADDADHKTILPDPSAEKVAGELCRKLSAMDAQIAEIIDAKDLYTLEKHAEELGRLSADIAERIEAWKAESRARIGEKVSEAARELRLAEIMGAKGACADVFGAAGTYLEIAKTYLAGDDFDAALSGAEDALEKAREAGSLARAGMARESSLALDHMKMASAQIAQGNLEGAKLSLRRGLELARSSGAQSGGAPPEDDSQTEQA
jgi:tetratricopeptide (TPR) repeat protein